MLMRGQRTDPRIYRDVVRDDQTVRGLTITTEASTTPGSPPPTGTSLEPAEHRLHPDRVHHRRSRLRGCSGTFAGSQDNSENGHDLHITGVCRWPAW